MSDLLSSDDILELFVFETGQLVEQLEILLLDSESIQEYSEDSINEIFRIMHTIKGSAALMQYDSMSTLAHKIEDLFFLIRENLETTFDFEELSDLLLECTDFMKVELYKIKEGEYIESDSSDLKSSIGSFLESLKQSNGEHSSGASQIAENCKKIEGDSCVDVKAGLDTGLCKSSVAIKDGCSRYICKFFFSKDCSMVNVRAFTVVNNFESLGVQVNYYPEDMLENEDSAEYILSNGFVLEFESSLSSEEIKRVIAKTNDIESFSVDVEEPVYLKNGIETEKSSCDRTETDVVAENNLDSLGGEAVSKAGNKVKTSKEKSHKDSSNGMISVNISKLDKLMDLVGELVMSQEIVAQNPDLEGLEIENFRKATRQLQKITNELQDSVMSIRMVPLAPTFVKMNRITRDMSKKLNKNVELEIIGEDTEIDKSIIEHISDPLMHLIRNAIDHGIESKSERLAVGKSERGVVTLEGRNSSNEVLIIVKDDGKGLDKQKLIAKAKQNGILVKNENEMTDKEIYSLILNPGFSCKDVVTEFSGRGVGMDVVAQNIASVNGSIEIDSVLGYGTTMTLRIPLTLAIIGGMNARVGKSRYTIPTVAIKESFRAHKKDVFKDIEGNDMIMVRGECYPVVKLYDYYGIKSDYTNLHEGVMMMVENDSSFACLFVDELLGGQQVVVKSLPNYMSKLKGISSCTILGDGNVSLILDIASILKNI